MSGHAPDAAGDGLGSKVREGNLGGILSERNERLRLSGPRMNICSRLTVYGHLRVRHRRRIQGGDVVVRGRN